MIYIYDWSKNKFSTEHFSLTPPFFLLSLYVRSFRFYFKFNFVLSIFLILLFSTYVEGLYIHVNIYLSRWYWYFILFYSFIMARNFKFFSNFSFFTPGPRLLVVLLFGNFFSTYRYISIFFWYITILFYHHMIYSIYRVICVYTFVEKKFLAPVKRTKNKSLKKVLTPGTRWVRL